MALRTQFQMLIFACFSQGKRKELTLLDTMKVNVTFLRNFHKNYFLDSSI